MHCTHLSYAAICTFTSKHPVYHEIQMGEYIDVSVQHASELQIAQVVVEDNLYAVNK